jgi:hypothetical protein
MYIGPTSLLFSVWQLCMNEKVFANCLRNMEDAKMFFYIFCLSTIREVSEHIVICFSLKLVSVTFTTFHIYMKLNLHTAYKRN